jgi:sugar/nucleoside kinase (ribokinase family)
MTRLLIVGGLTIDHFADGRSAPGGSVIHAGRAAVAAGVRPSFVTVAGNEPEAADGLEQLAAMGELLRQPSSRTTAFGHGEADGRRVLTLEATAGEIASPFPAGRPDVALLAPIADELPPASVVALRAAMAPRIAVFLIQGWLRRLTIGEPVHPLALDDVSHDVWDTFRSADAIVVSTEDLAEAPEDPFVQAATLRARLGDGPVLVLTLGPQGYLLDDPANPRVVASVPRRVVENVPMVGAGDTFGAVLALHLARGASASTAAVAATDGVIRMLESRA